MDSDFTERPFLYNIVRIGPRVIFCCFQIPNIGDETKLV